MARGGGGLTGQPGMGGQGSWMGGKEGASYGGMMGGYGGHTGGQGSWIGSKEGAALNALLSNAPMQGKEGASYSTLRGYMSEKEGVPLAPTLVGLVKQAILANFPSIAIALLTGNPTPAIIGAIASSLGLSLSDILGTVGRGLLGIAPTHLGVFPISPQPPSPESYGTGRGGGGPGERPPSPTSPPVPSQPIETGPIPAPNQPSLPPEVPSTNLPGLGGGPTVAIAPRAKPAMTPMQQVVQRRLDLSPEALTYSGPRKLRQFPVLSPGMGVL